MWEVYNPFILVNNPLLKSCSESISFLLLGWGKVLPKQTAQLLLRNFLPGYNLSINPCG